MNDRRIRIWSRHPGDLRTATMLDELEDRGIHVWSHQPTNLRTATMLDALGLGSVRDSR